MTLSKNKVKYIRSLKEKKYREEYGVFVAEGNKLISDLLPFLRCQLLVAAPDFLKEIENKNIEEIAEVDEKQLIQVSFQQNPQQALAVFYQPTENVSEDLGGQLILALDGIQDPGNLGTIVRLADWYGISNIYCSRDTVDIYNPKVIQATMGAIARVRIHYTDLPIFLESNNNLPIYGTFLDGNNMYDEDITKNGIIVMGNEGNGIRPATANLITKKLYIPNYPKGQHTSESLNVAIATAIICAEFRRKIN